MSAVGNGVNNYTVSLYEVNCDDPTGSGNLIHTQTIPYNGQNEILYSFLNIPNWEDIYDTEACYRVETTVNSVCDTYQEEAYFTITDQCILCMPDNSDNNTLKAQFSESIEPDIHLDNNILIYKSSTDRINKVVLLDQWGRLLKEQKNINDHYNNQFNISTYKSNYYIVITVYDDGSIDKEMIYNLK